jgi:hypothetical protein
MQNDNRVQLSSTHYGAYLLTHEDGRDQLFQVDYDYPVLASHLGWSLTFLQKETVWWQIVRRDKSQQIIYTGSPGDCEERLITELYSDAEHYYVRPDASHPDYCPHDGTDGTVKCDACGLTATDFISAAREWLDQKEGEEFDDPGYFESEEE